MIANYEIGPIATLIIAYNAGTSWFERMADHGHKLLSPSTYACNLCLLTHGTFNMDPLWKEALTCWNGDIEFLHRPQFQKRFGKQIQLPTIGMLEGGEFKALVPATMIAQQTDLAALAELFRSAVVSYQKENPGNAGAS
jgi:hypothetical protein